MLYTLSLCWLRRDLRLSDHTALAEACAASRQVAPVFIFDTTILAPLDRDDRRLTFIHSSLQELDHRLREHGSMLIVRVGDPRAVLPALAAELGADAVFTNRDYEPAARERDAAVARELAAQGRSFHDFKDQVVFEGEEILTGEGRPFRVFTPYKRAWLAHLSKPSVPLLAEQTPDLSRIAPKDVLAPYARSWTLEEIGFRATDLWLEPGERAARRRLEEFLQRIDNYGELRDFPSAGATSGLSVHLRFGTISIRGLMREAMKRSSDGARTWLGELIWREFFQMILDRYPHVTTGAFRPEFDRIVWPGPDERFEAWCEGRTGYPIVDAAMRHFNATGWMHNRLRMVVASFLVKDLLIDWRRGEAWFARYLLDFDLAANNGGWQWSASTGCDAQPWFRIFNPISQSRRFDPRGTFIRSVLPELRGFPDKAIHWPSDATPIEQMAAGCLIGTHYPAPIVDHATARQEALKLFKFNASRD